MQANQITLSVDEALNSTFVDQIFQRHSEETNRTTYRGPGHTIASPHTLTLYRTPEKRAGNYFGNAKTAAKLSRATVVDGANGEDLGTSVIFDMSASIPVGTDEALIDEMRAQMAAWLLSPEAGQHFKLLVI